MPAGVKWIDADYATATPADAAASCSACRGYMWANQHPSPSKFRPLRAPLCNVVGRATTQNSAELSERLTLRRVEIEPATQTSVVTIPFARVLVGMMPGHPVRMLLPVKWQKLWQGSVKEEYGGGCDAPLAQGQVDAAVPEPEDEIEDD